MKRVSHAAMMIAGTVVACFAGLAVLAGVGGIPARLASASATSDSAPRLVAGSQDLGWVSLTVHGAGATPVIVSELVGAGRRTIASVTPQAGRADLRHAARWLCGRRERRFVASATVAGVTSQAPATITTPSCAQRLRTVVTPAQIRPGARASVHVSDA
nr:hypothetical protein [Solirubrobacterales bacterium]